MGRKKLDQEEQMEARTELYSSDDLLQSVDSQSLAGSDWKSNFFGGTLWLFLSAPLLLWLLLL
jgi:hypothetical protein